MCTPTLIVGITGLFVAVAGTAVSVAGQKQAADQASANADANKELRDMQADASEDAGAREAKGIHQRRAKYVKEQRAALAANGVIPDFGTPLELQIETFTTFEEEALLVEYNARLNSHFLRQGAEVEAFQGRNAADNLRGRAIGTGIAGAGSAIAGAAKLWDAASPPAPVVVADNSGGGAGGFGFSPTPAGALDDPFIIDDSDGTRWRGIA